MRRTVPVAAWAVLVLAALPMSHSTPSVAAAVPDSDDHRAALLAGARAAMSDDPGSSSTDRDLPRALSSHLCDQEVVTDDRGDGLFDMTRVRVRSGCTDAWRWDIATTPRADSVPYTLVLLELDIDGRNATGCGGTDRLVAVRLGTGLGAASAQAFRTPGCRSSSWTRMSGAWAGAGTGLFIGITSRSLIPRSAFRWYLSSYPDGEGAGRDTLPNGVWQPAFLPPEVPRNVARVAGGTSLTVTWDAPRSDRGLRIRSYEIAYRLPSSLRWRTVAVPARERSVVLEGLPANAFLAVRIGARNAFGVGPWKTFRYESFSPRLAPIDVIVTPTGVDPTEAVLTWDIQLEDPSWQQIRRTIVTVTGPDGETSTAASSPHRLTGLTPGATHTVTVRHDNGVLGAPATVEYTAPAPEDGP